MEQRILGKTNLSVSILGLGTAPLAYLGIDERPATELVEAMLDAGVNVLDTAAMYPGSEAFIGRRLAHRRKDFLLISKCGTKVEGIDAPPWSPELISRTVDRALQLTRAGVIDVMLLHSCDLKTLQRGEALDALRGAQKAGKVRFLGYSGDNEAAAYAASIADVAVIEASINIVDQANLQTVLPLAQQNHVGIIAKRPIANAAWKDLSRQPGLYKSYAKDYTQRFAQLGLSPQDLGFAGDGAWPEIAIRFTLSFPQVSSAVIGTTSLENARANFGYVKKGPLPPATVERIRAAFRSADPNGSWKGLT
ncbi:MAG: aldo/keto reductase [Phycisphaerae bacterium]|nr:aldo/keto reductase [Phycisphaerae bacterium]MDW8262322.1 aldo/keto reductase [Phycisphaerales bacterium]